MPPAFRKVSYLSNELDVERRDNGEIVLRLRHPLGDYDRNMIVPLRKWAAAEPDTLWLAQRGPDRAWRKIGYGQGLGYVNAIAAALLARGLGPDDAVMVLSGNSIEHALVMYGAIAAGVPVTSISQAYSLMSMDHAKLVYVFDLVRPKLIFVQNGRFFEAALSKLNLDGVEVVHVSDAPGSLPSTDFMDLVKTPVGPEVDAAFERLGPDTVCKYLFTSGSTGMPKAVINTHRMLCANAAMARSVVLDHEKWRAEEGPSVAVDWLPWSHTFGGNANLHGALVAGASLYIDDGRPLPGLFDETIANLQEISPTTYMNVPVAYSMLLSAMEKDEAMAKTFFKRLKFCAYGGAALSQDLWERFQQLAIRTTGERVVFTTGWGSTETAPVATSVFREAERVGMIGLPLPGVELKLVPVGHTYEVRVRGALITPGYYKEPKKTAEAFDAEGFYCIGDAAKFLDPEDPDQGLVFDGRVAEDFKLDTGTWVQAGKLRVDLVGAAAPVIQDAVICGHDRKYVAALAWPNWVGLPKVVTDEAALGSLDTMLNANQLVEHVRERVRAHNRANPGSSTAIKRVLFMAEPASLDGGEITDKGYINQKAALTRRAHLVEKLYADPPGNDVIVI
ncbi:AMP-binding protein [Zavarzinia compransoris]|uniref:Acyl-CoA synthetase n=1 Tax=Zavarzinia compransoris TaxID=1264899 RepID=A0A317E5F8_9PROT|nr:AMP-binding protein [Zavarzinia compransoris]PWR22307.1 acyl-CoA synthetase [Zavarzinia compransoris]TDP46929.1 feruloyl-CoA synthase [Zavarzinia compransoris]